MPVAYCSRCGAFRPVHTATSRIQVQPRSGRTFDLVTTTCSCRMCGALLLHASEEASARCTTVRAQSTRRTALRSLTAKSFITTLALFLCLLALSCSTVPVSERRQLDLIPAETMLPLSFNSYREFLSTHKVIENTPQSEMVKRVGSRIQSSVERYFAQKNLSDRLKGYAWEFNLIEDKQVNAWAMPGGKVVVFTGLMPVAQDENGLAVVMGHEIAHAVANHGDERMSQGLITEMGGIALATALSRKPAQTQQLFMTAYGAGATVGLLLPFSRLHESEADHLGLIFMAMAGYDPRQAVPFWQRMSQQGGGGAPIELLSTHPADTKRIENIQKLMPEAMQHYQK